MNEQLERFFGDVSAISAQRLPYPETVRRVEQIAAALAARPPAIEPEYLRTPSKGHGRNLLFRDPATGLVVVAVVWPPKTFSRPHDHGTWGVVAVVEGEVRVTSYQRGDDGSDANRVILSEVTSKQARVGTITHVLPPREEFHSIVNPSETERAVTIHVYGKEIAVYRNVDLETGHVSWVRLGYVNEAPVPTR